MRFGFCKLSELVMPRWTLAWLEYSCIGSTALRDAHDNLANVLLGLQVANGLFELAELEHAVDRWLQLRCANESVHGLESA